MRLPCCGRLMVVNHDTVLRADIPSLSCLPDVVQQQSPDSSPTSFDSYIFSQLAPGADKWPKKRGMTGFTLCHGVRTRRDKKERGKQCLREKSGKITLNRPRL